MSDPSSLVRIPPLAPEIIECIVDQLRGDDMTLKQSALVSRSFHSPSRKNLFFFIDLDTRRKCCRLGQLLVAHPDIRRGIRQLAITLYATHEWFSNNTILAVIFSMLPCLNMLSWETDSCPYWNTLSAQSRTALVTLFQQPSLTTVTITALCDFPLSIFNATHSMKRLDLSKTTLQQEDPQLVILPHLDMLIIRLHHEVLPEIKLSVPNLRQLSFTDYDNPGSAALAQQAIVQQAIDTAADTLERINWGYNLSRGMWTSAVRAHD